MPTHIGHTAAEIARPTAAIGKSGATGLPSKRALNGTQQAAVELGAFYRRLCGRMDKLSANTAKAHKLARVVHFMRTCGEHFVDKGQQHYEEQQRQCNIADLVVRSIKDITK